MVASNPKNNDSTKSEEQHQVVAFYRFKSNNDEPQNEDLKHQQKSIQDWCLSKQAMGCIILAHEGINGTICFPCDNNKVSREELISEQPFFANSIMNISYCNKQIFHRLKVKIKSEIVTMNKDTCNPSKQVGKHITPEEWDILLDDPNVLVIDTRNTYEVQMGTFRNALNPNTHNFRDFPLWLDQLSCKPQPKAIAMFCTGGIRCEKATSYALCNHLFDKVPIYHLQGGILSYLNTIPPEKSKFIGEDYLLLQKNYPGWT